MITRIGRVSPRGDITGTLAKLGITSDKATLRYSGGTLIIDHDPTFVIDIDRVTEAFQSAPNEKNLQQLQTVTTLEAALDRWEDDHEKNLRDINSHVYVSGYKSDPANGNAVTAEDITDSTIGSVAYHIRNRMNNPINYATMIAEAKILVSDQSMITVEEDGWLDPKTAGLYALSGAVIGDPLRDLDAFRRRSTFVGSRSQESLQTAARTIAKNIAHAVLTLYEATSHWYFSPTINHRMSLQEINTILAKDELDADDTGRIESLINSVKEALSGRKARLTPRDHELLNKNWDGAMLQFRSSFKKMLLA